MNQIQIRLEILFHGPEMVQEQFLLRYKGKILIDMETGDIKLEMNKEKDKIQLFTKNEYIN